MADRADDAQRWMISELFRAFGIDTPNRMHGAARRILKLDYLTDLRSLTRRDADELISELRRAATP